MSNPDTKYFIIQCRECKITKLTRTTRGEPDLVAFTKEHRSGSRVPPSQLCEGVVFTVGEITSESYVWATRALAHHTWALAPDHTTSWWHSWPETDAIITGALAGFWGGMLTAEYPTATDGVWPPEIRNAMLRIEQALHAGADHDSSVTDAMSVLKQYVRLARQMALQINGQWAEAVERHQVIGGGYAQVHVRIKPTFMAQSALPGSGTLR